jgi:L-alanine-DL-glutamate epimerase-like enolase superfamily enzyme
VPVHELLGLSADIPPTDFTIGIDEPAVVAERAARARRFPALKIKVGGASTSRRSRRSAAVYDGPIRVDANTGWSLDEAIACCRSSSSWASSSSSSRSPPAASTTSARLQERSSLPIVADESSVTIDDLEGSSASSPAST